MTVGVLGVGVDTVDLADFAEALAGPGTRFGRAFSATERRQARERSEARGGGTEGTMRHLAVRWAAKEAVVKAWSASLHGAPPRIPPEELRWSEIETVCDAWGRPAVRLGGRVRAEVEASLGRELRWHLSLSHDGGAAVAFVVLEG